MGLLFSHLFSSPMDATSDIAVLRNALPQDYCKPLKAKDSHLLEYEFYSASYSTLTDVVIGLQTAMGHLVKVTVFSDIMQIIYHDSIQLI